ncbi:MAG: MotA/TolQ/ExbB proton channel family protein, partial [Candidatus Sulfotelmatobacter sp.]
MDRANQAFRRDRRKLVNKLNLWVGSLKSIASTAPYLGLAGTCLGTLSIFQGYVGSRNGFFVMVVTQVDAAFLSTAAGLLVAVPAVVSYNYLRSLIDSLDREVLGNVHELTGQSFQVAQRLPLAARFSKIPFAAVAAPLLAFSIMAYATFASFHAPTGLHVALPSA